MVILSTSEHAESHCSAEIARYQLVNFFSPIKLEIQSKASQNCSGWQGPTQQAGPSTKSRTIQHFLHDEGFCLRHFFLLQFKSQFHFQERFGHRKWFCFSQCLDIPFLPHTHNLA